MSLCNSRHWPPPTRNWQSGTAIAIAIVIAITTTYMLEYTSLRRRLFNTVAAKKKKVVIGCMYSQIAVP